MAVRDMRLKSDGLHDKREGKSQIRHEMCLGVNVDRGEATVKPKTPVTFKKLHLPPRKRRAR